MSPWAIRRKILTILVIFTVIVGIFYLIYSGLFIKQPTCFDGVRNGAEEGLDCGGNCNLVCAFSATESNVFWSRSFRIVDGVYNVMALVENPNFDLQLTQAYIFRLYDSDNVLIKEVTGIVSIDPAEIRPIFEPSVNVGERAVSSTFFELVGEPILERAEETQKQLIVRDRQLADVDTAPELYVTLYNQGIRPQRNTEIVAVLYDRFDNVYQASKTFIEFIDRDSEAEVFFTWPSPLTEEIRKIDIFTIQSESL